ncbi:hypothetical protein P43SY_005676 [Pythium insidiosum]|uniref:Cytochrome b5 heme-binding domain-containing protein n=1 Tax=Pythium insidiosum TaxID=114742 RepID=A0AAD5LD57_PYTIN|nr:hypothetical protein P43SY_005676 [Pythium insidiosum]
MCEGVISPPSAARQQRTCAQAAKAAAAEDADRHVVQGAMLPVGGFAGLAIASQANALSEAPAEGTVDSTGSTAKDPCATGCLNEMTNQVDQVDVVPTPQPRRSRTRSRRQSSSADDNQEGSLALDLEEFGLDVLSLADPVPSPPKSVVVDYEDSTVPDRSRAALLLGAQAKSEGDCAPDACQPLDFVIYNDFFGNNNNPDDAVGRERRRTRKGSISQTPTSSRRGKSVILSSSGAGPLGVSPTELSSKVVEKQAELDQPELDAPERCSIVPKLCLCEVRLHTTADSCWLVANNAVYDVTGVLASHPAGPRSILRKAGGKDCTQDMKFHSKAARKLLEKCFIGKLEPCGEAIGGDVQSACTIM